jgi:hypothetical protein
MIRVFTKDGSLKTTNETGIGNRYYVLTYTSSATSLQLGTEYTYNIFTGSNATTWTLPDITDNANTLITCMNIGTNDITLNTFSGLPELYTSSYVTTTTLFPSDKYSYLCDGTRWIQF